MIDLPEGTRPTIDRDFVIANIQAPSGLASQKDEDEDESPPTRSPPTEVEDGADADAAES